MKEYRTSLASWLGVLAFCHSLLQAVFPPELRYAFAKLFNKIFHWFSSYYYFEQLYLSFTVSITGTRLSLTHLYLNSTPERTIVGSIARELKTEMEGYRFGEREVKMEKAKKRLELNSDESEIVSRAAIPAFQIEKSSFYDAFALRGIRVKRVEPSVIICSFKVPPLVLLKLSKLSSLHVSGTEDP
ncbi:hypothetical protein ACFX11_013184 [Malus domestica]